MFLFKQKTAYERRISDWSSDVCSSDLQEFGSSRGIAHSPRDRRRNGRGAFSAAGTLSLARILRGGTGKAVRAGLATDGPDRGTAHPAQPCGEEGRHKKRVHPHHRSEERRVGKECVRTCRFRWTQDN